MKKLIFLLSLFAVLFTTQINAQWYGGRLDSLVSAGNADDTVKFYPGGSLYGLNTMGNAWVAKSAIIITTPSIVTISIVSDSISGGAAANVGYLYIQAYEGLGTPTEKDWQTVTDGTITSYRNGALTAATGGIATLDKNVSGYSVTRQYITYVNTNWGHRQFRVIALCTDTQVTSVGVRFRIMPLCQ